MKNSSRLLLAALLAIPAIASAQHAALGRWRTVDDNTGKPRSIVEVYDAGTGTINARVLRVLDPGKPDPVCDKCEGTRRGKPVVGMVIAWNLRPKGARLEGGSILDPDNGKVYSVRMTPVAGGEKLEVRGFLGVAWLGRTQAWLRER
jgi:uncharacterized protein (DUF2147 family)